MQNLSRTEMGPQVSSAYYLGENSSSHSETVARREELTTVNGLFRGDKKTPNPFAFNHALAIGGHREMYQSGTASGLPFWQKTSAPFHVPYFNGVAPERPDLASYEPLYDRCLDKIFEQIRESNLNLVVDAVESGQSIRMVRDALKFRQVRKDFLRSFTKKRPNDRVADKASDYVAGKWLEYRYGWLPLLSSIFELLEQLGRKVEASQLLLKGRSGKTSQEVVRTGSGTAQDPWVTRHYERSSRVEVCVVYRRKAGQSVSDYTSLNPLGIAWELVPYSFVVDWFVNVGAILDRWENYVIVSDGISSGYRTNSYREIVTYNQYGVTNVPQRYTSDGEPVSMVTHDLVRSSMRTTRKGLERSVFTTLPLPSITPTFKNRMGAKQFADAASLIRKLF